MNIGVVESGDGSKSTPFKTISEAIYAAKENDTISINSGTYREYLDINKNGLSLIGISDSVFITGTNLISDWESIGEGIFRAYLPLQCSQLFTDSIPQVKARFPNHPVNENRFDFSTTKINYIDTTVTLQEEHPINSKWAGASVWMLVGHRWLMQTGKISAIDDNKLALSYVSNTDQGSGIAYITNTIQALDTIGEWHWQNDSLYYFYGSGDISKVKVEAQTRTNIFQIRNAENVNINNINTYGGNIILDNSNHCKIENSSFMHLLEYHYIPKDKISWYSSYSRSEWTSKQSHGIGLGVFGTNNTINNCEIGWSYGDCVTLFGNNNSITNSYIHDGNIIGGDLAPIAIGGNQNEISHNEIYNAGRDIITCSSAKSFKVRYNNIYNAGLICWDLGGIYAWSTDGEKSEISYNWVHDINSGNPESFWGGSGIYLDNNSSNYIVHHNVVWNCKGSGLHVNMPANNINIFNNTAFNCEDMLTYFDRVRFGSITSGNCYFTNNFIDAEILDEEWLINSNNLSSKDELLTNTTSFNFSPADDSPLIDAGRIVNPGFPFYGTNVDIGAYEKDGILWSTGPYSKEDEGSLVTESSKVLNQKKINLYPNPARDFVFVENFDFENFEIFNLEGKIILKGKSRTINIKNLPKGKYIISFFNKLHTASTILTKQ